MMPGLTILISCTRYGQDTMKKNIISNIKNKKNDCTRTWLEGKPK
jgi:hypothetical protein